MWRITCSTFKHLKTAFLKIFPTCNIATLKNVPNSGKDALIVLSLKTGMLNICKYMFLFRPLLIYRMYSFPDTKLKTTKRISPSLVPIIKIQ